MKEKTKRIIILLLICITCLSFVLPPVSFAEEQGDATVEIGEPNADPLKGNFFGGILDSVIGILLYPVKLSIVIPGLLINLVGGETNIYKLFFNQVDLTNINVFKTNSSDTATTVNESIAGFYTAIRGLAIAISLVALVYIGIRMAISSIAEEKARYKHMLVNWLVGFALLFVMHYIIIIIININEMLVTTFMDAANTNSSFDEMMNKLFGQVWWIPFTTSFGSAIMYVAMGIISLIFLFVYIKRKVTVCLLIVISPLICVSYSVDKIGNNKSEILNTWLKELLYNVLIQPFHCIIFLVLIDAALELGTTTEGTNFGQMMFAVILTLSVFMAQKIIREVFGFNQSSSLSEKFAIVAFAASTASNVKSIVSASKARNKNKAQLKDKQIKKLGIDMPGGEEFDGKDVNKLYNEFKESDDKDTEKKEIDPEVIRASGQRSGTAASNTKVKKRRRLKNAPAVIRKPLRWYGRNIKKFSYYDAISKARKERKVNKTNKQIANLTDEKIVMAIAQSYRKAVNPKMGKDKLAGEFKRINEVEDVNTLSAQEIKLKLAMEAAKMNFGFSDEKIEEIIKNG